MKKLFSAALLTAICCLSVSSCKKKDADPMGYYTCTCFITKTTTAGITLDTAIIKEDLMEKSLATTYCSNTQAANTDTFGRVAKCTLK